VRKDGEEIGLQTGNTPWIREALHDLCQPLTALECGLYIGTISPDGIRAPRAEELMATITAALAQCERMTSKLRAIQGRMNGEGKDAVAGPTHGDETAMNGAPELCGGSG
jgi:hypothetical protein